MYMYVCKCTHTGCTKMHVNHGYVFTYMYVCTGIPADMCMYYMYIHICMYIHFCSEYIQYMYMYMYAIPSPRIWSS